MVPIINIMNRIEEYYNKFNEDKRLKSRHGQVEYTLTMKYIHKELAGIGATDKIKILDIGAGTGAYSVPLAEEGYEVHAIELVKHNVARLKAKSDKVFARQGNALKLTKKYDTDSFDIVLLFGPMYHLFSYEDKLTALKQAALVVRPGGVIMVAYCMNDYALIRHGIMDGNFAASFANGKIDEQYNVVTTEEDLYSFVKLDTIDLLRRDCNLERKYIFTPDGPTDYIRTALNSMSEEEFKAYISYIESISQRPDLLGAASHTVDVLTKTSRTM